MVTSVIGIDYKHAIDVDQQHGILEKIGDAHHLDVRRQLPPAPIGKDLHLVATPDQVVVDARAGVVWQQDDVAAELGKGIRVQVIGVAVREPDVTAAEDVIELLWRNLVRHSPATEIGTAPDPGIGSQDRITVETAERGIADRLETYHGITSSTIRTPERLGKKQLALSAFPATRAVVG